MYFRIKTLPTFISFRLEGGATFDNDGNNNNETEEKIDRQRSMHRQTVTLILHM